jgi:hypothetical protein
MLPTRRPDWGAYRCLHPHNLTKNRVDYRYIFSEVIEFKVLRFKGTM